MLKPSNHTMLGLGVATMTALLASNAAAVTMPYSENFDDGVADDFEVKSGDWTVVDQAYNFTGDGTGRSLIAVDGVPESGFVMTTDFVINETPTAGDEFWTSAVGYYLFGSGGSFETANSYIVDVQYANAPGNDADQARMRIHDLGGSGQLAVADFGDGSMLDLNTVYTMTVTGIYDGVNLDLTFSLTDGATTTTINGTDSTPSLSDNIVLRHFGGGSVQTSDVSFDNVNIAVPEPASLMLLGAGASLMVFRRR